MKYIKIFEDYITEAKQFGVKDIMKAFKNKEDWGDTAEQVYMKGGNLVYVDTWFYGEAKAMKQLEDSWKKGGSNYDFWNKEHGVDFKIVDTFSEVKALGRHKKLTSDGIVGVVLKVTPGKVTESINEAKEHSFIFNYNTDEDDIQYIQKVLDRAGADAIAKAGIDSEEMVIRAFNAGGLRKARKAIEADGFEIQEAKEYMNKIDLKDFKKIKKGSVIQYMGSGVEVIDNNGYVLKLKDKDGKVITVNKSQFDHGGRISEVASSTDGGNKSNGNSHHDDHKGKSIAQLWKDTYGEEFHAKYPAIAKIVKSRPGMDKRELKRIWDETYGENFEEQYPALWQKID
jgi:hypothetical protein